MFFKYKMRDVGHGALYEYVIIEADSVEEAYDDYVFQLPLLFGDPTLKETDQDPVGQEDPFNEPWPIFTKAFFEREFEQRSVDYELDKKVNEMLKQVKLNPEYQAAKSKKVKGK